MLARARETERILARQPGVSGRCTPMLACQREFDAPRHPLTSFYPTSRSRVIPPHAADIDATTRAGQIKFSSFENWIGTPSRSRRWNRFLVTHSYPKFTKTISLCNLYVICLLFYVYCSRRKLSRDILWLINALYEHNEYNNTIF